MREGIRLEKDIKMSGEDDPTPDIFIRRLSFFDVGD